MKTLVFAVVCVSTLAAWARGDDSVDIGPNKELVIEDSILVPVPSDDWDWYTGQTLENRGVKISTYVCKSSDEKSEFNLVVFHDQLKENKEKFAKDLVQGAANGAKRTGFVLTESLTAPAKISWPGSIEYRAILSQPDAKLYVKGFVAFGREIYALQYSAPKQAPTYFDKVAKGMKNLANKTDSKNGSGANQGKQ